MATEDIRSKLEKIKADHTTLGTAAVIAELITIIESLLNDSGKSRKILVDIDKLREVASSASHGNLFHEDAPYICAGIAGKVQELLSDVTP